MLPALRFVVKLIYHITYACLWQMLGSVNTDSLPPLGRKYQGDRGGFLEQRWPTWGSLRNQRPLKLTRCCPAWGCREEGPLELPCSSSYLWALSPAQPRVKRRTDSGFAKFYTNLFLLSTNVRCLPYVHTWWGSFYSSLILISSLYSNLGLSKTGNVLCIYTLPGNENKEKMSFCTFCLCASSILYIFSWCLLSLRNFAYYSS